MTVLLAAVLLAADAASAAALCPELDPAGLAALARDRGGEVEVVFFASWCAACKEHLTAAHGERTIVVGAFDKRERIDAVATALGLERRCYFDKGLAEQLKVAKLPATIKFTNN